MLRQLEAALRQSVEVGSRNVPTVEANILPAEVVSQKEDDIRPDRLGRRRQWVARKAKGQANPEQATEWVVHRVETAWARLQGLQTGGPAIAAPSGTVGG
jgi:hypothetical protein